MTDKEKTQSPPNSPPNTPEEITEAFLKIWQGKWAQMLKEKNMPPDFAGSFGFGQAMGGMPFMMPFMQGFPGFGQNNENARIAELEQRIAILEKKMAQRSKAPKKNTKPKA
ncbi:MAG: hypothetical protein JWM96_946 [Alphaproteobacteria bacterium]|nr:hypothetical protein [Alphaproteobacteria bacterium]